MKKPYTFDDAIDEFISIVTMPIDVLYLVILAGEILITFISIWFQFVVATFAAMFCIWGIWPGLFSQQLNRSGLWCHRIGHET